MVDLLDCLRFVWLRRVHRIHVFPFVAILLAGQMPLPRLVDGAGREGWLTHPLQSSHSTFRPQASSRHR